LRFLFDESTDLRLGSLLDAQGHSVQAIVRDHKPSLSDPEVFALALHDDRVLVTEDRDFGELVVRLGSGHAGVIFLRLGDASVARKLERLQEAVELVAADEVPPFLVVRPGVIRSSLTPDSPSSSE